MEYFVPHFRRDPNAKVQALYSGVASGGRTMTSTVMRSPVADRMEASRSYGPGIPRGEGGQIAVLVIGGMETTLDEIEYLLQDHRQKAFVPRRTGGQVANMCRMLMERRNDTIRHFRKNPSEAPKPNKKRVRLHLPVGFRMMQTPEPGLKVLARI